MLDDYGVKKKPITTRNPQANAIVERVHQTIGNIIRTFELQDNYLDEDDPCKGILAATAFAIRATYHTTLQKSPGQLVFGRDTVVQWASYYIASQYEWHRPPSSWFCHRHHQYSSYRTIHRSHRRHSWG